MAPKAAPKAPAAGAAGAAGAKGPGAAPPPGGKDAPAEEKKPFLETRKGEIFVRVFAVISFILALVMLILYIILARRDALITESLRIMREFAVEYDPRYEERDDFAVIALAHNLSAELSNLATENEEIQEELDKIFKTLSQWVAYNKNLYYFSKEVRSWQGSVTSCVQKYANLVSVKWGEEQAFLDEQAKEKKLEFWIGLRKNATAKNGLLWLAGFGAGTMYWNHNQPAGRGVCIYVSKTCSVKRCWNDDVCVTRRPYICKKEPIKAWYYALR